MTHEFQALPRRAAGPHRVPAQRGAAPLRPGAPPRAGAPAARNHYVVTTERVRNEILVLDQAEDWSTGAAVKWRWSAPRAGEGGPRWGELADVRVRATQAYGTVVLVAMACGRAAMVRQATKRVVWQALEPPGEPPLAVERLAGGVLVTACGGAGSLRLYAGASHTAPFRAVPLPGARGVLYDPRRTSLWALGDGRLLCYRVTGRGEATKLTATGTVELPDAGRDLQPVYGDEDALWLTGTSGVYRLDLATMTCREVDAGRGVASYVSQPSGIRVRVRAEGRPPHGWGSPTVDFLDGHGRPLFGRTRPGAVFTRARLWTPAFH
ncbi:DUF6528 family protein [Streptomyces sp. B1866]|uniref:DUF6528 family protein n=1 Tax=Streptomyces sp. B1866 TaxID=3075431 RepID=UPI00288D28E5|nr:DUF6528 family protein [Streptomyces sp. B1866]MDT3395848.1 DUF6528 family protein [Streptomyces sp. B1866]